MEKESIMRVPTAETMAMKVVKGNSCHGLSGKHGDSKSARESGRTCMKPVERITPEAKALTIENNGFSMEKAGK